MTLTLVDFRSPVSIKQWVGNFPKPDKSKIVIAQQTNEGLNITVSSIITGSSFFFYIKLDTFI